MYAIYGASWIPSIYPSRVSINIPAPWIHPLGFIPIHPKVSALVLRDVETSEGPRASGRPIGRATEIGPERRDGEGHGGAARGFDHEKWPEKVGKTRENLSKSHEKWPKILEKYSNPRKDAEFSATRMLIKDAVYFVFPNLHQHLFGGYCEVDGSSHHMILKSNATRRIHNWSIW